MTLLKNSTIENEDFNNLLGSSLALAAPSDVAAQQKAGYLWGVGYGDRGYGQSLPTLSLQSNSNVVRCDSWNSLRSILLSMLNHQGLPTTTLPPVVQNGGSVVAEPQFSNILSTVDTNRLSATPAGKTLYPNIATTTRAASWGNAAVATIVATAAVSFSDENSTRFFFNTGCTLNINLTHANVSSSQNQNWNSILLSLGTIIFSARNTSRTGSGGNSVAIGYYNLTNSFQTIFNGTNIGTGAYSANDVLIEARRDSFVGINGGNGAQIIFRITLIDEHTNTFSDSVAAGTSCSISVSKSTTYVTGIETPISVFTTNF